jgi:hypothetical protein
VCGRGPDLVYADSLSSVGPCNDVFVITRCIKPIALQGIHTSDSEAHRLPLTPQVISVPPSTRHATPLDRELPEVQKKGVHMQMHMAAGKNMRLR